MKKLSQKQIIIVFGGAALALIFLVVFFFSLRRASQGEQEFSLKIWGTDSKLVFTEIIRNYKTAHSKAKVDYTQFDPRNYESALLNALASGEGPDVFYLGNRDLPKSLNRLYPVNPAQFNLVKLRELFPTVVEQDFVSTSASGSQIFALPLYLDTLALVYNRDFFDQAAIIAPPKTWDDFQSAVPKLRDVSPNGQITRAAAAIGGSDKTVDAGADLLELLMMQNGAKMTSEDRTSASFAEQQGSMNPGTAAFNFYLQFANSGSPYYTWNDGQPDSLESFIGGKTAMIFNYQSAVAEIKKKSPFLRFAVAQVPQPRGAELALTYPKYYGLAVSKQSQVPGFAWDFILYLAANPQIERIYLEQTGRPPALRQFIGEKLSDPTIGVFVKQALTARSWYEVDDAAINEIVNNAVTTVLSGQADSQRALRQAQDQVSQLMIRAFQK